MEYWSSSVARFAWQTTRPGGRVHSLLVADHPCRGPRSLASRGRPPARGAAVARLSWWATRFGGRIRFLPAVHAAGGARGYHVCTHLSLRGKTFLTHESSVGHSSRVLSSVCGRVHGPSAPRVRHGGLKPFTTWALGAPLPSRGPQTDHLVGPRHPAFVAGASNRSRSGPSVPHSPRGGFGPIAPWAHGTPRVSRWPRTDRVLGPRYLARAAGASDRSLPAGRPAGAKRLWH